jgi:hypothetical protein
MLDRLVTHAAKATLLLVCLFSLLFVHEIQQEAGLVVGLAMGITCTVAARL